MIGQAEKSQVHKTVVEDGMAVKYGANTLYFTELLVYALNLNRALVKSLKEVLRQAES